jgi:hypothetical protein
MFAFLEDLMVSDIVSVLKDLVLTFSGGIGAYVAWQGLSTWNRQQKGGVEYDLARRLLRSAYELREAIKGVRHPFMWSEEMPLPDAEKGASMSPEAKRYASLASAYQARWDKISVVRTNLQTDLLEGEVLWGREIYDHYKPLFELQSELYRDVHSYLGLNNPNELPAMKEALAKSRQSRRQVLYDLSDDKSDDFTKDVNTAIAGIEDYLKLHLRK